MSPEEDERTGKIIGAAIRVHRTLGQHFQELTYQRALAYELKLEGIHFHREFNLPIYYRSKKIHTRRVDFFIQNVIVEIKAKVELEPRDFKQTLAYLKLSRQSVALLLNFGSDRLEIKRIVN